MLFIKIGNLAHIDENRFFLVYIFKYLFFVSNSTRLCISHIQWCIAIWYSQHTKEFPIRHVHTTVQTMAINNILWWMKFSWVVSCVMCSNTCMVNMYILYAVVKRDSPNSMRTNRHLMEIHFGHIEFDGETYRERGETASEWVTGCVECVFVYMER